MKRISSLAASDRPLILSHLDTIRDHPAFRGTRRCQDLLRFVVECALDGGFDRLKERTIGVEVFGREAAYDTAADSIVRVTANEVRKRLAQFYLDAGRDAPVRVELPPGSYVPEFEFGSGTPQPEPPLPTVPVPPADAASGRTSTPARRWLGSAHLTVTALLLGICLWLVIQNLALRQLNVPLEPGVSRTLPWSALLDDRHQLYVVLSDLAVGTSEDLLHRQLLLQDYINRSFLANAKPTSPEVFAVAQRLLKRQFTSVADATIAAKISRLDSRLGRRVMVRFARNMQIDDFRNNNIVLLGSSRANPWGELFEHHLNFRLEYDERLGQHVCRNRSPRAGEQALYIPAGPTGTTGDAYALVAFLPNLQENGHVLWIAGTNMEGTEEAGEFITSLELSSAKLRSIGIASEGPPRHFEVLLKVKAVAGSPHQRDIIAYRLLPQGAVRP